jgi:hypothetical protein
MFNTDQHSSSSAFLRAFSHFNENKTTIAVYNEVEVQFLVNGKKSTASHRDISAGGAIALTVQQNSPHPIQVTKVTPK